MPALAFVCFVCNSHKIQGLRLMFCFYMSLPNRPCHFLLNLKGGVFERRQLDKFVFLKMHLWLPPRSFKSGLVLPTQIFGLFGPPKKRVNFDKFNQRQKCVFCVLNGSVYVSRHETCYVVIT